MHQKRKYIVFIIILFLILFGMIAMVSLFTHTSNGHGAAMLFGSITICMFTIYLCEGMDMRADITLFLTMVIYLAVLLPLENFTPERRFFLTLEDILFWQGIPILIIAGIWYLYNWGLSRLAKDVKDIEEHDKDQQIS